MSRTTTEFRAVFVSDVHLGFGLSREADFANWLERLQTRQLYLNGDILDGWRLRRRFHWNAERTQIAERLLAMVRDGTQLFVLPGNHDDFLRRPVPRLIPCELADEFVHECADGRRLLVTHGDLFDPVEVRRRGLSRFGGWAFDRVLPVLPRSVCHAVKRTSKSWFGRPNRLTERIANAARSRNLDGVVFGHIHRPVLECRSDGFLVANSGDWVEHSSFLTESCEGDFCLVDGGHELVRVPAYGAGPARQVPFPADTAGPVCNLKNGRLQ